MADTTENYGDDEIEMEVHVTVVPREEVIERLGIDRELFDQQLSEALDAYIDSAGGLDESDEFPPIEDMQIELEGHTYRLSELAEIEVEGFAPDEESE